VGPHDQPWFVNAVAEIRTSLTPQLLFEASKKIERRMGRTEGPRWGPRFIDLDLLLYGQEIVHESGLVIPHPELHRRRFVLVPLCEIASYVVHPAFGISARGLLERLEDPCCVERYDPAAAAQGDKQAYETSEHGC
jgi:2-amino-4-hydroxy-6-hydroxymethyldihydropteridine diphosphokinase